MKYFLSILTSILLLLPLEADAEERYWSAETLPVVYLQDSLRYTCNPDGILSSDIVESIDSVCRRLEVEKGVQTVVVVVGHIEGDDPYEFNKELHEKYGIGQKGADNGLVFTIATLDRSFFISPGKGLEGTLPDAICKRIENRIMVPLLKDAEWDAAALLGVRACAEIVLGDDTLLKEAEESDDGDATALVLALLSMGGFIGAAGYSSYKASHRNCPRCGAKRVLVKTDSKENFSGDWIVYNEIWSCKRCGYSELAKRKVNRFAASSAGGGSFGGGSHGGGGSSFGGGSFGGGSYGGGGAGGRF